MTDSDDDILTLDEAAALFGEPGITTARVFEGKPLRRGDIIAKRKILDELGEALAELSDLQQEIESAP